MKGADSDMMLLAPGAHTQSAVSALFNLPRPFREIIVFLDDLYAFWHDSPRVIVYDGVQLYSFKYSWLQPHTSFFVYIFAHSPGRVQYGVLFDGYHWEKV